MAENELQKLFEKVYAIMENVESVYVKMINGHIPENIIKETYESKEYKELETRFIKEIRRFYIVLGMIDAKDTLKNIKTIYEEEIPQ